MTRQAYRLRMEANRKAAKAKSESEKERKRQSYLKAKLGDQSTYSVFIKYERN